MQSLEGKSSSLGRVIFALILAICWWPWPTHAAAGSEFLTITNADRNSALVASLKQNPLLDAAASAKLTDMFANNYWAHVSPTGKQAWDFETEAGYKYVASAENLSENYTTAQAIVAAWMQSPEHKKNMLNPLYREVGFAMGNGTINGQAVTLAVAIYGSTVPGETPPLEAPATPHAVATHHAPSSVSQQTIRQRTRSTSSEKPEADVGPKPIDTDSLVEDVIAADNLSFADNQTSSSDILPGALAVGLLCGYAYMYSASRHMSLG